MNSKQGVTFLVTGLAVLVATGCGKGASDQGKNQAAAVEVKHDPITITMYNWGNISDDDFQRHFVQPIQAKFPYITLEQVVRGKGTDPDTLVAGGSFPDLIVTNDDTLSSTFAKLDLLTDISQLAKKENIDLSRFESAPLDRGKVSDQLVGLPYYMTYGALFYNKDIFDKFAVVYPKDGMSWDEVLELTKKLTRQDSGVQYRGLDPQSWAVVKVPGVTFLDPKTDKPNLSTPQWKETLTLYKSIISIPGNEQKGTSFADTLKGFITNRTTAMVVSNIMSSLPDATKNGLNWDMAQLPSYKSFQGSLGPSQTTVLAVSKTSKHQEDVMKIIGYLTSDEAQTLMTRQTAQLPSIKNQQVKDTIGSDLDFLKGKNIKAVLKSKPMEPAVSSVHEGDVRAVFEANLKDFAADKYDVNTLINKTEDEMTKQLATLQSK